MNPYLSWLLKDVLPHLASQHRTVRQAHTAAKDMVRQFDSRRREHEERLNLLQAVIDDLERLCRVLGATEEVITAATSPPSAREEVPHAGD